MNHSDPYFSTVLEHLSGLRYHLDELIQSCDSHNRYASVNGELTIPSRILDRAKDALDKANKACAGKQIEE